MYTVNTTATPNTVFNQSWNGLASQKGLEQATATITKAVADVGTGSSTGRHNGNDCPRTLHFCKIAHLFCIIFGHFRYGLCSDGIHFLSVTPDYRYLAGFFGNPCYLAR